MRKSEKEISEIKKQNVFIIEKLLLEDNLPKEEISLQFSGIMHINNSQTFSWDWLPQKLINRYEVDVKEESTWPAEKFGQKYVHPFSLKQLAPLFYKLLANKESNIIDVFEYARLSENSTYEWIHKTCFFSNSLEKIVGVSHFLRNMEKEVSEEQKILGEYEFIRKNFNKYMQLTARQKEVLRLLALGNTNQMISIELNISPNTVRCHRNDIHEVLDLRWKNINHSQIYVQFALHFGLL